MPHPVGSSPVFALYVSLLLSACVADPGETSAPHFDVEAAAGDAEASDAPRSSDRLADGAATEFDQLGPGVSDVETADGSADSGTSDDGFADAAAETGPSDAGDGAQLGCPVSSIQSPQGGTLAPLDTLALSGAASQAAPGHSVAKWEWSVIARPPGSDHHVFWPNANAPEVVFGQKTTSPQGATKIQVTVAGTYELALRVWDDAGVECCTVSTAVVHVVPDHALHVELTWTTPGAPVIAGPGLWEGADLDLHLAHPLATATKVCTNPPEMCGAKPCKCQQDSDADGKPDPWFHTLFDCFWFNANPNWGAQDPKVDDNPKLAFELTEGWGPEIITLAKPEVDTAYQIGVFYWDDHDNGAATARVRVFVGGVLVADVSSPPLKPCDMWWVTKVAWPAGKPVAFSGQSGGVVTPGYAAKFIGALGGKCAK